MVFSVFLIENNFKGVILVTMSTNYMVVKLAANIFLDETQTRAKIIRATLLAFGDLCLYCHIEA